MRVVLGALVCVALAACTFSPAPISAGGAPQTDARLVGTWQVTTEGESDRVQISNDASGELLVEMEFNDGGVRKTWRHHALIAHIGNAHFASLYDLDPDPAPDPEHRYMLTRYEFRGRNRFLVHAPSDWVEEALKDGRIAGRIVPDRHIASVVLGATGEELRAFMRTNGTRFFHSEEPLVFERVK